MILRKLEIELVMYGDDKGKYKGIARFQNTEGDVALNLTSAHCDKIFIICADGILSTAKEAAANLTCSVIEHCKSLGVDS